MASGDSSVNEQKNSASDNTSQQQQLQIPYIVAQPNDYIAQLKRFSTHLIAHCTIYNDICNKLLKKTLQNNHVMKSQPDVVGGLRNDLTAMNVMFGMMKMFCEQIVCVTIPDLNCFPTLKTYFSQTVEFTKETWRKILTCKELRLVLAKEFDNKGMIDVLQRMVAYVRGEEIQSKGTTLIASEWYELSTSGSSATASGREGSLDNITLPDLFTVEELELARNYDKQNKAWSKLVTSGLGILKCIAAIGGAAILGAAAGTILGAVVGCFGGPLGMAVGIGVGMKFGATVGGSLGALHKTVTVLEDK